MYIVFITGKSMGKRFDDPEEMGRYIVENLGKGIIARVELYV